MHQKTRFVLSDLRHGRPVDVSAFPEPYFGPSPRRSVGSTGAGAIVGGPAHRLWGRVEVGPEWGPGSMELQNRVDVLAERITKVKNAYVEDTSL